MTKTDNTLRTQTIMLTMKALEVISKALDIIAADEATDISHGIDTDKHGGDTDICCGTDTDISHGTDTELTRRNTDEKRMDTDESLCAATPLPSRGGAGGGVCISNTDTYRADAIRFNEKFLKDNYELRYNTMLKTTEFRRKGNLPPNDQHAVFPHPRGGG